MAFTYLSHMINTNTPLYGGEKAIDIIERSSIDKGDSSNTKSIKFPNHTGTHIDFPRHFNNNGKTINDYSADFWVFNMVHLLNYPAKPEEIIDINSTDQNIPGDIDLLLINTGFSKFRGEKKYWNNNPGLSPGSGNYLRKQCPHIKAVGFDFISVSSYQNRIIGREAHRSFLNKNDILLIEDMNFDKIPNKIIKVIALPLMIDNIDGSPITIIAEYE